MRRLHFHPNLGAPVFEPNPAERVLILTRDLPSSHPPLRPCGNGEEATKKAKRARPERVGWSVGAVLDFLELSEDEAIFIELKLALAKALRHKRERAGLTQT